MNDLIQQILDNPIPSLVVVGNLIIIESLLSVDNAAVLATMVMDLPQSQRNKALRYGIIGAYFFRFICLLLAGILINIWWLKPLGGLYLVWLVFDHYKDDWKLGDKGVSIVKFITLLALVLLIKHDPSINLLGLWIFRGISISYLIYLLYSLIQLQKDEDDDGEVNKSNNVVYKFFQNKIGPFWSTVILVEIMDLAFSIDNVFAAVAFSKNLILISTGVFIGILAMRFVAQGFVKLMEKYRFLESAAFIVIAILGIKLLLSLYEHFYADTDISKFLASHTADIGVSIITVSIFVIPIATSTLFNYPKKKGQLIK